MALSSILTHAGVWAVALTPDGRRAITAGEDFTARVWDVLTGRCTATLAGHSGWVVDVAVTPNGSRCITASHDGTARCSSSPTSGCTPRFTIAPAGSMRPALLPNHQQCTVALLTSFMHSGKSSYRCASSCLQRGWPAYDGSSSALVSGCSAPRGLASQMSDRGSVPSAIVANLAMSITWCLNVRACSTFGTNLLGCLNIGQWFSSCGRQSYMGLPSTSQIV